MAHYSVRRSAQLTRRDREVRALNDANEEDMAARRRRFATRDAQYREALGLAQSEALPRELGNTRGHGRCVTRSAGGL